MKKKFTTILILNTLLISCVQPLRKETIESVMLMYLHTNNIEYSEFTCFRLTDYQYICNYSNKNGNINQVNCSIIKCEKEEIELKVYKYDRLEIMQSM